MKPKKIAHCLCPHCGKPVEKSLDTKAYLPFCSTRCKMIDLGKWMGEKYVVEGPAITSDHKNESESD
jgi:endogenous inhibitor of DNA gyrase (YacG/DUF329 family)